MLWELNFKRVVNLLLNFRLYDLIFLCAAILVAFGTTTEHVLTFIRRGAIKPIIPFSQGVHVPRTVLTSQNYEKEINNSVYAMTAVLIHQILQKFMI